MNTPDESALFSPFVSPYSSRYKELTIAPDDRYAAEAYSAFNDVLQCPISYLKPDPNLPMNTLHQELLLTCTRLMSVDAVCSRDIAIARFRLGCILKDHDYDTRNMLRAAFSLSHETLALYIKLAEHFDGNQPAMLKALESAGDWERMLARIGVSPLVMPDSFTKRIYKRIEKFAHDYHDKSTTEQELLRSLRQTFLLSIPNDMLLDDSAFFAWQPCVLTGEEPVREPHTLVALPECPTLRVPVLPSLAQDYPKESPHIALVRALSYVTRYALHQQYALYAHDLTKEPRPESL